MTAVDPSEAFVAAARDTSPDSRRAQSLGRGSALRRRRLRRGARAARRPLHGRPRRRAARDGARDASRRSRRSVRLGPCRRTLAAGRVLAGGPRARSRSAGRIQACRRPRRPPRRAARGGRAGRRCRRRRPRRRPTSRASRTGGSHLRSVSARQAPMPRRSTTRRGPGCAIAAESSWGLHPSP